MDRDEQRDEAEEAYWRNFCPECDGRCESTNGHAELDEEIANSRASEDFLRWFCAGE